MAEESKLTVERLSALLGISDPDETVKVHLEFALENAEDTVKKLLPYRRDSGRTGNHGTAHGDGYLQE